MFSEEGGAGGEGVSRGGDIIDEPDPFVFEKISGSIRIDLEGSFQVLFSRFPVLLAGLREGEVNATEGIRARHEIELGRENIGNDMSEQFGLIETSPLLAPWVERNEENDIRKGDGCLLDLASEKGSDRERKALGKMIFVGMDDPRDPRIFEWARREDAVERTLAETGKAQDAGGGDGVLAVRTAEIDFSREVFRAASAEECAFGFAGETVDGEEEVEKMLKYKHNVKSYSRLAGTSGSRVKPGMT